MIILRKLYSTDHKPENEKSYIPYEEQVRRRRKTNLLTAAGLGSSIAGGKIYYNIKNKQINKKLQNLKNEHVKEAERLLDDARQRLSGEQLSSFINNLDTAVPKVLKNDEKNFFPDRSKAEKRAILIGATGLGLTLAARKIMKERDKKRKYYESSKKD